MGTSVKVARVGDIAPGSGKIVEASGKQLALFNADGKFYAISNICAHQGGPLGEGDLEGTLVACPWHGWEYDVTNGVCTGNPAKSISCYPVRVEGDDILVDV